MPSTRTSSRSPEARERFDDLMGLLEGEREVFRYPVGDLVARYGEGYVEDAELILGWLEAFAAHCGDDLAMALHAYAGEVQQTMAARQRFRSGSGGYGLPPEELGTLWNDERFKQVYLYSLTLSSVLNRSRYELLRDVRQSLAAHLCPESRILEIGSGNCLNARLACAYGQVEAYERNEFSLVWQRLLGLAGQIDLRIEDYRFDAVPRYDLVMMIELLEHLTDPLSYLQGAHGVLKEQGLAYLTFALRMPQADHLYEFSSVEECRTMAYEGGFKIVAEQCLIDTYRPFEEEERWLLAEDPEQAVIYCCLARKQSWGRESLVNGFNEEIDAEEES